MSVFVNRASGSSGVVKKLMLRGPVKKVQIQGAEERGVRRTSRYAAGTSDDESRQMGLFHPSSSVVLGGAVDA